MCSQHLAIEVFVEADGAELGRPDEALPVVGDAATLGESCERRGGEVRLHERGDVNPPNVVDVRDVCRRPRVADRLHLRRAHLTLVMEREACGALGVDHRHRYAERSEKGHDEWAIFRRALRDDA